MKDAIILIDSFTNNEKLFILIESSTIYNEKNYYIN